MATQNLGEDQVSEAITGFQPISFVQGWMEDAQQRAQSNPWFNSVAMAQSAHDAIENMNKNHIDSLKQTSGGIYYDPNSVDSYIDAMNTQTSWNRDDTALIRFVEQAKAAGINPALLLSQGGAEAFSTIGSSVKGSQVSANKKKDLSSILGIVSSCAAMVGAVGMFIGSLAKMSA